MRRMSFSTGLAAAFLLAALGSASREAAAASQEVEQLRAQVNALMAENAELRQQVTRLTAEVAELRRAPPAAPTAVPATAEPDEATLERLNRDFERAVNAARETGSPNALRLLQELAHQYPRTEAGLQADGLLTRWGLREVELTAANAPELFQRINAAEAERARQEALLEQAEELFRRGDYRAAQAGLLEVRQKAASAELAQEASRKLVELGLPEEPAALERPEVSQRLERAAAAARALQRAERLLDAAQENEELPPSVRARLREEATGILKRLTQAAEFAGTAAAAEAQERLDKLFIETLREEAREAEPPPPERREPPPERGAADIF